MFNHLTHLGMFSCRMSLQDFERIILNCHSLEVLRINPHEKFARHTESNLSFAWPSDAKCAEKIRKALKNVCISFRNIATYIQDEGDHLFHQMIYLLENLKSLIVHCNYENPYNSPRKILQIVRDIESKLNKLEISNVLGNSLDWHDMINGQFLELKAILDGKSLTMLSLNDCDVQEDTFFQILKTQRNLKELRVPEIGVKDKEEK